MFGNIYSGKRVLVTGHTGFKGSWLVLWLKQLGAEVAGYALPPPTTPSHYDLISPDINSINGCILDPEKMERVFIDFSPEIVFHLAAQPLVRLSYTQPKETFETNVIGTVNVLDVCRRCSSVCAIVNITSDKCYENREWVWGYRENDAMGGYDPYSASKGCAELVASSYRNSFFNPSEYERKHHTLLASCRAGNVIGGGDWAKDRIVPDCIRALQAGAPIAVRNPSATRPWQHVLEPLSGYLWLAVRLAQTSASDAHLCSTFNFGPVREANRTVAELVTELLKHWPGRWEDKSDPKAVHEANWLHLSTDKADAILDWQPAWAFAETICQTARWYQAAAKNAEGKKLDTLTRQQIDEYCQAATAKQIAWAKI